VGLLAQLCDAPAMRPPSAGARTLLVSSVFALLLSFLFLTLRPVPFAESVQLALRQVDQFFRDDLLKQTTGFAILGITVLGAAFSLRKRTRLLRKGSFGSYRGFHALAGALALAVLLAHTGMRFGENLNLTLMGVFTGACAVGALTGVASALESTPSSSLALQARKLRRPLAWAHLLLFWPLPILVGLHIFSVYYF
jgi:nitrite reductase (NADH) large subunit